MVWVWPSPKLNVTESPTRFTAGENVNVTVAPGSTVAGLGVIVKFPPPPPPITIVLVSVSVLPQSLVAVTRTWYVPGLSQLWLTLCPVAVSPSPNVHDQLVIPWPPALAPALNDMFWPTLALEGPLIVAVTVGHGHVPELPMVIGSDADWTVPPPLNVPVIVTFLVVSASEAA